MAHNEKQNNSWGRFSMAMQSEFYKDLSNTEKTTFRLPVRQFKAFLLLGLVAVIVTLECIFIKNEMILYIVAIVTSILLATYPVLLMLDKWKSVRRKIDLLFIYEEKTYQSYQIRRYDKSEFIQEKGVRESDPI